MSAIGHLPCGLVEYSAALRAQALLAKARRRGEIGDLLLTLEHPAVYTRGRRTTADELPLGEAWYRERGVDIQDTDRGGKVTLHNPGQLVAYPIVDLGPTRGVAAYVAGLEETIVSTLDRLGVQSEILPRLTGVWTRQNTKIASIGVHVARGITTHGLAINVCNDLEPFSWIVPCGLQECEMTSVAVERGESVTIADARRALAESWGAVHRCEIRELAPTDLGPTATAALDLLEPRDPSVGPRDGAPASVR
ncbi:MAG: lipoyl(octanoyl) transferase LipB [Solirubrobacterales bacterium]